jgi:O-antigen ligase
MTYGTIPTRTEQRANRATYRTAARAQSALRIDNLGAAWLLLLIGTFSFANGTAAVVLSGHLNSANIVRYVCVVGALALLAPELRSRFVLRFNPLWLFASYAAVCVLSAAWSVSAVVSLGKAAELSVATAAVVLAANRETRAAIEQLFAVTFWFGVTCLVIVLSGYLLGLPGFWVHSTGVLPQMDTWFLSSNNIGYLSALTATVALDRALRRTADGSLMWATFGLAVATAISAQGRTGLACFVLGVAGILVVHRRFKALLLGGFVVFLTVLFFSEEIMAYLLRGEHVGSLQTLTGRTLVWQAAWESFLERPVLGSGFGVGSRYLFMTILAGWDQQFSSAHNGLMELLTGVGLVGFAPWVVSVIWTVVNAARSALRGTYTAAAAIIPLMLVITTMSSGMGGWFDFMLGYFLCCVALLQRTPSSRRAR